MRTMLSLLASVLFIAGCASEAPIVSKSNQIQAGMSGSQVQEILGPPQNRQFNGNTEAWQYCSTDYTGFEADNYVVVWMSRGVVSGMETYRNTLVGTCESFFKQVDFGRAPDTVVELRIR